MHDIPEGVARYDMALIINGLIEQKYFKLEELNNRIMFNYGVTEKKILLQLLETLILKKVVLLCQHQKFCVW